MTAVTKTTIFRYSNAGESYGVLDYDEATHEEDLDGLDVLTVKCRDAIGKRERLVWKDNGGVWHEHIVDSATREHGRGIPRTTAKCSNSINELYGLLARNVRINDGTMFGEKKDTVKKLMAYLLQGTRWTLGTCGDFGAVKLEVWHKSVRECIADICTETGGELVTSIQVGNNGVTKRIVGIVKQRGSTARMRQFRYGANVSNVKREVGQDQVYTAIVAYGAKVAAATLNAKLAALQRQYDESEDSDERKEIQKDITKVRDDIRKLNENDYAERITVRLRSTRSNAAAIKRIYGTPNINGDIEDSWMTYTDAQCPSARILRAKAERILRANDRPVVYYQFDVAQVGDDLWRDVRLGNRVICLDEGFRPTLQLDERVSYISRQLAGRMKCVIAIGERTNPLVEQYHANNNLHRATTGNKTKQNASTPPSSGGSYAGADWPADEGWDEEGYDPDYTEGGGELPQPAGIRIQVPPSKLDYVEGEEIDYSGMVVVLIDGEGNVFTDAAHPDGVVPDTEQSRPVQYAEKGSVTRVEPVELDSPVQMPLMVSGSAYVKLRDDFSTGAEYDEYNEYTVTAPNVTVLAYKPNGNTVSALCASDSQGGTFTGRLTRTKIRSGQVVQDTTYTGQIANTYTYDSRTVYYVTAFGGFSNVLHDPEWQNVITPRTDIALSKEEAPQYYSTTRYLNNETLGKLAWMMVYGEHRSNADAIPVNYTRTDGTVLTDSFDINVSSFDGYSGSGGGKFPDNTDPQYWYGDPQDMIDNLINPLA